MAGESTALMGTTDLALGVGQLVTLINNNQDIHAKVEAGYLVKSVAGAVNVTLTAAEWQYKMLEFTGAITANIAVIVPVTSREFVAYNNTTGAFTLTVRTSGGTGLAVTQGNRSTLICDGTDVRGVGASAGGTGTVTSVATTSPLTGGPITTSGAIAIQDAVADGTTKGAATFAAADFDAASGVISIDYTNGQAATSGQKGFLTAADWSTFNGKLTTATDANLSTTDITTNDVSITKHGFAPKAPNDATKYLNGVGAYTVPAGSGGDASTNTATSVDNEVALFSSTTGKILKRASTSGLAKLTSGVLSVVTAPSGAVVGDTDTVTLTNKRITRRVVTLTDAATVTPNADTTDVGILTTLSQATTFANPTGTPTNGQLLTLRIKSTTARGLTFGTQYRGSTDQALPATTSGGSLTDYIALCFNSADTKWDYLAKNFGF